MMHLLLVLINGGKRGSAQLLQIYSREVGQPYITFVGITLRAVVHALWLMIPVVGIRWSFGFYVEYAESEEALFKLFASLRAADT
ncbi:hypothetical protein NC651_029569 [Populus alba x Populus x berolinensis]|nr:hypothetical protein NC651_029569 [Populus alba x Populus x berolinensis]